MDQPCSVTPVIYFSVNTDTLLISGDLINNYLIFEFKKEKKIPYMLSICQLCVSMCVCVLALCLVVFLFVFVKHTLPHRLPVSGL